jgi:hypothetical protein
VLNVTVALTTDRFFLVGFMGTGKSTLGREVAEQMGIPFLDLDERVERSSGMKVGDLLAKERRFPPRIEAPGRSWKPPSPSSSRPEAAPSPSTPTAAS